MFVQNADPFKYECTVNARSDPDPGLQHKCASNISHSCEISIVRNNEVAENATQNFSTKTGTE